MFSNETIRKLREIHMGVMAEQLSAQLEDPQFRNVPFEDRLAMLVDAEWSALGAPPHWRCPSPLPWRT